MNDDEYAPWSRRTFLPPLLTYVLCGLCGLVFFLQMKDGGGVTGNLAFPGFVDGYRIMGGEYWGLITCFFLHGDLLHIAFNVYWLYRLGTALEPYIGWKYFIIFWVVGTAVGSVVELAIAGTTGIGASGFVYALFGLIWIGGKKDDYLARIVDSQVVTIFIIWLFLCIGLTWAGMWDIANGAHVGGVAFGCLCGYAFIEQENRWIKIGAVVLTLLVFEPLVYAPWLEEWRMAHAYSSVEQ